jgi:abortive infection bacteriophage resistance protein
MGGHFLIGAKNMEVKPATTYQQQVELIRQKGFVIEDTQACIEFLKQANYYRLSAYFLPFRKEDKTYFPGIPLRRIQRIYMFDSRLRGLLFHVIETIELHLRTQLAYYFAHHYGPLGYLNADYYSSKHNAEKFAQQIERRIRDNRNTLVVQHHQTVYHGEFPIWVIIEFFTMGMLSRFYSDFKLRDQKAIALEYGQHYACIDSWLRCITDLRNCCAHYARLYYWNFISVPKMPKDLGFTADERLFSQILMLKYLYPNAQEWNGRILGELEALIEEYLPDISLKHIGFPQKQWQELLRIT